VEGKEKDIKLQRTKEKSVWEKIATKRNFVSKYRQGYRNVLGFL